MIRLVHKGQELVFRITLDIPVRVPDMKEKILLAELSERQPYLGEVIWGRGDEGRLRCQVRKVGATIRLSRSRCKADYNVGYVTLWR
jgi:hypothetical protein